MLDELSQNNGFDFDAHRKEAVGNYRRVRPSYERFADALKHILTETLKYASINVHSVEARAKTLESFSEKVSKPAESDPNRPRYLHPLSDITDLAGIRVITYFPGTLLSVDHVINSEFDVIEKSDKADDLVDSGRFGYQSIHYLVRLKPDRVSLPEYKQFDGLVAEVQLRTILQHAWAEMEHDIQYKSTEVIPTSISRRFMALAGLLEIADREFQEIQQEDESLRRNARQSLRTGNLEDVEITPDALKSYLDARFGADGRMSDFSYTFGARMLRHMGFSNFREIDECIRTYDDDRISRIVWGTRQGQISRFEDTLLAAMGENYGIFHPWASSDSQFISEWFPQSVSRRLKMLREAGVQVGSYLPAVKKDERNSKSVADDKIS